MVDGLDFEVVPRVDLRDVRSCVGCGEEPVPTELRVHGPVVEAGHAHPCCASCAGVFERLGACPCYAEVHTRKDVRSLCLLAKER